jgi:hypothetical protein
MPPVYIYSLVGKMCSAKQSIRRVFAKSERAADIRGVVQSLNMKHGEQHEAAETTLQQSTEEIDRLDDTVQIVPEERSAWGAFIAPPTASDDDNESDDASDSTSTTQWTDAAKNQRASRKVSSLTFWADISLSH